MLTQLLRHGAIYTAGTLLTRALSLLLIPFYTRVLSPRDYGVLDLLLVIASLVNVTVALEISQGLARNYADAATSGDRRAYASTALWFTIGAYSIFSLGCALFAGPLSRWLFEADGREGILRVAVASIWAEGIFYLCQNQLRWELRPAAYATASLTFSVVAIGATLVLVLAFGRGFAGVVWGRLAGSAAGVVATLALGWRSYGLRFDRRKCREMLAFSLPLVPSSVGVIACIHIDRVVLKELAGLGDVGIYGVAYRFASVVALVLAGFQTSLVPLVLARHREPSTPSDLARVLRHFVAFVVLAYLGLSLLGRELVAFLTTPEYHAASELLPFLIATIAVANMSMFAPGLVIAKRTGLIAGLNLGMAALNLALSLTLVPMLGRMGAALATLASVLAGFVGLLAASQRHYPIPYEWGRVLPVVVGATALVVVGQLLDRHLYDPAVVVSVPIVATKLGVATLGGLTALVALVDVRVLVRAARRVLGRDP